MIALLLAVTPEALAWRHIGYAWEDFPVSWRMDDDIEDSLPEGYDLTAVEAGYANWETGAACAGASGEFAGREDLGEPNHTDGDLGVYIDDPAGEAEVGVLGVTFPVGYSTFMTNTGEVVISTIDADIVFNDNVDWGTTEDVQGGGCSDEYPMEGVGTHEIGHLFGLGHSCEQDEECSDSELRDATMYWSTGPCDTRQIDINSDDIEGLTSLYSVSGSFAATGERKGAVPLTVSFALESEAEVSGADWNFGDGGTGAEYPAAEHTYTVPGQYSVSVNMTLLNDVCGETTYNAREVAYVTACGEPIPEEGSDGFFEMMPVEGLVWQTVNHTDVSVYGCVDDIQWRVYEGTDTSGTPLRTIGAWSPEIEFPAAGTYTVVVIVGGPAGEVSSALEVDVTAAGAGCATVPLGWMGGFAAGAMAGLGGLAAALRRRR